MVLSWTSIVRHLVKNQQRKTCRLNILIPRIQYTELLKAMRQVGLQPRLNANKPRGFVPPSANSNTLTSLSEEVVHLHLLEQEEPCLAVFCTQACQYAMCHSDLISFFCSSNFLPSRVQDIVITPTGAGKLPLRMCHGAQTHAGEQVLGWVLTNLLTFLSPWIQMGVEIWAEKKPTAVSVCISLHTASSRDLFLCYDEIHILWSINTVINMYVSTRKSK